MNERQRKFAAEYVKDRNATQAAIRAGYSKNSAHVIGSRLLKRLHVLEAVKNGNLDSADVVEASPDAIIRNLKRIGAEARASGIYAPAIKAEELVGRHIGMWPARMELTGANGGPVQFAQAPFDASRLAPEDRQALRKLLERAAGKDAASEARPIEADVVAVSDPSDKAG